MSEHIHRHIDARVLTLTLARPKRKNALDLAMYEALTDALNAAATDPEVRVVLLQADGDTFCAGNDLHDFMQNPPTGSSSPVMRFLAALVDFPKPLLAAVQGGAVGIGTTVLLHCDLAFAASNAFFKVPFVSLALVPEAASSFLLPGLIGHRRAFSWIVRGESLPADVAAEIGLINEVTAPDALRDTAAAAAAQLAALPPSAVRETKRLLKSPHLDAIRKAMADEGAAFVACLSSPEAAEAIMATLQKRPADFSRFA